MEESRHYLRPSKNIHKILISTTSRMVGEFEGKDILITHSWHNFSDSSAVMRLEENPVSRTGFIVAFETEPQDEGAGLVIPDYSPFGDTICSYLSVLFGKRFDNHGLVESNGGFNTPDLATYSSICDPNYVFNSHKERKCFSVPLNLKHFSALSKLITDHSLDPAIRTKINAACKFYMQALQNVEFEPEISYLHLITAGEILSGFFSYPKEEILDQQMLNALEIIKDSNINKSDKIINLITGRMLGIKKKFVKSLCSLIDDDFFEAIECEHIHASFNSDDIEKSIGSAYDLRSKYVHTGIPFGMWIKPSRHCSDLQYGKPVVEDREFSRILERAPKFLGLERFIRYCILSFMLKNDLLEIKKSTNA